MNFIANIFKNKYVVLFCIKMVKKQVEINEKPVSHNDEVTAQKTSVSCAVDGCRKNADYRISVTDTGDKKNKFNTGLCYDHEDSIYYYFHFGDDKYPNRKHIKAEE
jgi:hypothetical protein